MTLNISLRYVLLPLRVILTKLIQHIIQPALTLQEMHLHQFQSNRCESHTVAVSRYPIWLVRRIIFLLPVEFRICYKQFMHTLPVENTRNREYDGKLTKK